MVDPASFSDVFAMFSVSSVWVKRENNAKGTCFGMFVVNLMEDAFIEDDLMWVIFNLPAGAGRTMIVWLKYAREPPGLIIDDL